jgi:GPH family glycoside/pentoside/hexuronide:cation symporter
VKYALHARGETISLLSGLAMLASLGCMPLWNRWVKTLPLANVFLYAVCISCIGMFTMGLFPSLPGAVISALVYGGALQGINVSNILIRAGLVSRNIERTGNRNEASYYGLMNSALRLVGLLQSLAMVLVGSLFGYISGAQPGTHPDLAFRFTISFLPVVGLSLAVLFTRPFFKAYALSIASFQQISSPTTDEMSITK